MAIMVFPILFLTDVQLRWCATCVHQACFRGTCPKLGRPYVPGPEAVPGDTGAVRRLRRIRTV